jgi:hypothetical protein
LALHVLSGSTPVARLARDHQVSRRFLYRQADTARAALDRAFDPPAPDDAVLFHLPVTKDWLKQRVLSLVLSCHSPYRGVIAVLADLFDTDIALGTVHNFVQAAVARAPDRLTPPTTWRGSASAPTTRSSRPGGRSWWVSTPPAPSATS